MTHSIRISSGLIEATFFSGWQATTEALQPMQAPVSNTTRPGAGIAGERRGWRVKLGRGGDVGIVSPARRIGASFCASPGRANRLASRATDFRGFSSDAAKRRP